jgi:hypothetical protein
MITENLSSTTPIAGGSNNRPNLPSAGSARAQPGMLRLCYGPG